MDLKKLLFKSCLFPIGKQCRIIISFVMVCISLPVYAAVIDPDLKFYEGGFSSDVERDNEELKFFHSFESALPQGSTNDKAKILVQKGLAQLKEGEKESGLKNLSDAWEIDKRFAVAGLMIGLEYIQKKNYEQALKVANTLQENRQKYYPDNPAGYTLAGIAYDALGKKNQAKENFEKALSIQADDYNANQNLAVYAVREEKFDKAIIHFNKILLKRPENLSTLVLLARTHLLAGDYSNAIAIAERGLTLKPNENKFKLLIGVAKLKSGDPAAAVIILESAVLSPSAEDAMLHFNLALAYEQTQEYDKAIKSVETALDLSPNQSELKLLYARLMVQRGNLKLAQDMLKELAASHPRSVGIKELQAKIEMSLNNPEAAVELYKQVLKKWNNNFVNINLALAEIQTGDTKSAFVTLQTWLLKYPDDVLTRSVLADALLANGLLSEAQLQYEKILTIQPNNAIVRNNLSWVFLQNNELDKALYQAQKANELAPNEPQMMDSLAVVLLRKGQTKNAIDLLQSASELQPDNLDIKFHLTQAYVAHGEANKAKKILVNLDNNKLKPSNRKEASILKKELGLLKN